MEGEHDNPYRYQPMPDAWESAYQSLVNKKYRTGLTEAETARLAQMKREADEFQAATPFQQWQKAHNDQWFAEIDAVIERAKQAGIQPDGD